MSATTKHCPQCGEEVLPAMVRCRGCGFRLLEKAGAATRERRSDAEPAVVGAASSSAGKAANASSLAEKSAAVAALPEHLLAIACRCGHRLRVKPELVGRKVKCPKCGAAVAVGAESTPASAPATRFEKYADYAAAIERRPPETAALVELRKSMLAWSLNRMINRLERRDGDSSERAGERRLAVLELAATRDQRAVDAILPLVEDPWEVVRQGAAQALGDLGDPVATPALVRLLDDFEMDVKREATLSLGKIGDARATPALQALAIREPALRVLATDAVAKIGNLAVPYLIHELGDGDPAAVLQAILTLQRMKASMVTEPLAKLLQHPMTVIRVNAAETLGLLGARAAIPLLTAALNDSQGLVRAQAVAALKRLGDRKIVKAIVPLLNDADAHVRARAIESVGELGDAPLAPAVLPSLGHSDASVRAAAADTLRRLGNPLALGPLLETVKDADENVRLKAVTAICQFKSESTLQPLLNLLFDPAPAVRAKAADALGEIGHRSAVAGLQNALRLDAAVEVRMAAARSLGKIGDPESAMALEGCLQDEHAVRCRAVAALGEIAAKSSQPALLAMLRDDAPEIRFHAAQALGELGDVRAVRSLECLLADESPLVRRGAAKAMIKLGDPRGEKLNELAEKQPRVRRPAAHFTVELNSWTTMAIAAGLLIAIGGGGAIWLWGVGRTPTASIAKPAAQRGRVASVAFSPDGDKVAVGRTKGLIEVWDVASGKIVDRAEIDRPDSISGIAFTTSGDVLYTAGSDVNTVSQGQHEKRRAHQRTVEGLRIAPGGKFAITWSSAAEIYVWSLETGTAQASLQLKPQNLPTVAIDAAGERLAWGSPEGIVTLWNVAENDRIKELRLEKGPITGLAFSGDGESLAALSPPTGITIWNIATGETIRQLPPPEAGRAIYQRIVFSADNQSLLAQDGGRVDRISMAESEAPATIAEGRGVPTDSLSFDPSTRRMACGSPERTAVWLYDLGSGKPPAELDAPSRN